MKYISLILLVVFTTTFAFADIRPPETPKPTVKPEKAFRTRLVLRTSTNVDEPTLTIPRSAIKELRARLDEIEGETDANASVTSPNYTKTSTIVSGLFLSLAFVFGGIFVLRNGSTKTAAGLILLAICSASASIIYANVAPPIIQTLDGSLFSDKMKQSFRGATGTVKVKVVKESSQIELVVPRGDEKLKTEE